MKFLKFVFLVLVLGVAIVYSVTETHSGKYSVTEWQDWKAYKKVTITQTGTPPADFTETLVEIYGIIDTIVIDAAGTDTSYKIYLKDAVGNTLFSKTDCTTGTDPMRYAISEVDTSSKYFRGARVAGACTLEMADGDDATMTSITITIYYWTHCQ